ncbi:TPA: 50S ribosomal protein L3 [Candidatus Micrarchaeota archaeon]|nr:MAG: 50S ribosomal protein L3 [Candidatus Micrarchaeota archaeon CG1_02_51_15]HII38891.1 50S ribosomal protein L3 [Candidatus Micrarchaeota archaeon]
MGKKGPRRGSVAFWHRCRAPGLVPRVRCWPIAEKGLLGFAGYKVGMEHVLMVDDSDSPFKGQEVTKSVTFVEVPPAFGYAIVLYENTIHGVKALCQACAKNASKDARRRLTVAKKEGDLSALEKLLGRASAVRMLFITTPRSIGLKKTPEVYEVAFGGDVKAQFESAKAFFGKEVHASDVLKEGDYVDVIAVTKGKGWQGVVKRFGVALNPHKATGARRHGGTLGAETQAKVFYTIPRAGQMGFHRRTDLNKRILKVGSVADAKPLAPKSGFTSYGEINGDFIVLEGSIPGPAKRFVRLRKALRPRLQARKAEVKEFVA